MVVVLLPLPVAFAPMTMQFDSLVPDVIVPEPINTQSVMLYSVAAPTYPDKYPMKIFRSPE